MLFSGLSLDRAHHLRRDADLARLAGLPAARFVPFWRGFQLVSGTPPSVPRLGLEQLPPGSDPARHPCLLLGVTAEDTPVLAIDISGIEAGEDGPPLPGGRWTGLRAVGGLLPAADAALLAYARGMLIWRSRSRFCGVCGSRLLVADAGHSTRCADPACGAQHFPRTDPATIMLVTDGGDRALLGRQAAWPPGMHSCLAGFVEPGESLEEAVAREVREEVGLRVESVAYAASQPWPFPSSLMIGFIAVAEAAPPRPDRTEIEEARWFTRAELDRFGEAAAPGPDGLFLPSRDSISRHLIETWRRG